MKNNLQKNLKGCVLLCCNYCTEACCMAFCRSTTHWYSRNGIHTIGVKTVDMACYGARFAVFNKRPVSDCSAHTGLITMDIYTYIHTYPFSLNAIKPIIIVFEYSVWCFSLTGLYPNSLSLPHCYGVW